MKLLFSLLFGIGAVLGRTPLVVQDPVGGYDIGGGLGDGPLEMAALSAETYTVLGHEAWPQHSVRVKKLQGFCDDSVKAYAGYVDVEARHLFFYFFESRREPEKDDVVMWINGGPGGSSSMGMLMEMGPCNIKNASSTEHNPYSWTTNANMIFLDQPAGVGFSYADHGEQVFTTEDAAKDVAAFFAILSSSFPQYATRPLHIAGESYGGHYVPIFAAEIYDQNARLVEAGHKAINLKSIILVNGVTHWKIMLESFYDMVCTGASGLPPTMHISVCTRMKQALPRCSRLMQTHCYDSHDEMNCQAATSFCENELMGPYYETGRNPYDVSKMCEGEIEDTLCFPTSKWVTSYLNQTSVRKLLGTDSKPQSFALVSWAVNVGFQLSGDTLKDAAPHLGQLLERGVRALVLAGAYDAGCGWVSNDRMTRALEWYGQGKFGEQELRGWKVDGEEVGKARSWGPLSFASVYGAGHMSPRDKPKETLALFNRWLAQEAL